MVKEIAKLVVVKPVLGNNKKYWLEKMGFTKSNSEWSKEGTVEELKNFWDEIDVYKTPIVKSKEQRKYTSGMIDNKVQRYYVHNDYELDFYLQVEKIQELEKTIDMLRNDSSAANGELVDKIRALENDNSGLNAKLKTVTNQMK